LMHKSKTDGLKKAIVTCILVTMTLIMASSVYGDYKASEDTYKGLKLFSDVLEEIQKNYVEPVDTKKLITKAIEGMVHSLDPHSDFMPPEAFQNLQDDTRGEFGGLGIVVTKRDGLLTVISPIEGTPAYRAGIQANDVIIKVNGESTRDMMLWEAVKKMRGKPGTKIKITVMRQGLAKPMEISLVRAIIPLDSVHSAMIKPGYGYLWITNFRQNTAKDVKNELKQLEGGKEPLKGLILDLRDDPGGLLNQAVAVADIFLEKGTIVSIKGRNQKDNNEIFKAKPNKVHHDYPIVVLINGGTASAAEIVTGALHDNHRALVIGTRSFGKGSVQTVKPLRDGYGLKYTVALYYTPSGKSIQAEGIVPDLVVKRELLDETSDNGIDSMMIKEKDLKNHLPAEGKKTDEKKNGLENNTENKTDNRSNKEKDTESDIEKLLRIREAAYAHNNKKPETLLLDSQINRAYEILKGYNVFKSWHE